jgi:hypothetical protein
MKAFVLKTAIREEVIKSNNFILFRQRSAIFAEIAGAFPGLCEMPISRCKVSAWALHKLLYPYIETLYASTQPISHLQSAGGYQLTLDTPRVINP